MGKNDSIDYDNLTYGDIFSAIKKLGINICNDEKMLKYQLQNKKKAKYEMGNFCEQYGLPPFAPSRQKGKKYDKSHKSYSHKKYKKHKNNFVKPNDFYAKKENVSKQYDKQRTGKGKCFNYGKPGHLSKDCKRKHGKLKNKFNMLNIDDKEQEELFRILESNNSFDSLEDDFSFLSNSWYQSADDSFNSPNIKIGCGNSCCNNIKSVKTLTKSEESEKLIIQLINQIQNPELQKEYLDKFKKNLVKNETDKKQKSTISFEETLERLNKKKYKNLTVNDLQHEIIIVKQEISELKHKK